jgi:hypothetical protein
MTNIGKGGPKIRHFHGTSSITREWGCSKMLKVIQVNKLWSQRWANEEMQSGNRFMP